MMRSRWPFLATLVLASSFGAVAPRLNAGGAEAVGAEAVAGLRVLDGRDEPGALVLELPGVAPTLIGHDDALGFLLVAAGEVIATIAEQANDSRRSSPLARVHLRLEPGGYHTLLVITGARPEGSSQPSVETLLLHDDLEALPPAGLVSLRLVHAAPPAGPLRFELRSSAQTPASRHGAGDPTESAMAAVQLAPLEASERLLVLPDGYELLVHGEGQMLSAPTTRLELRANVAYTFYLFDVSDDALTTLLMVDAALPAPPQRPPG